MQMASPTIAGIISTSVFFFLNSRYSRATSTYTKTHGLDGAKLSTNEHVLFHFWTKSQTTCGFFKAKSGILDKNWYRNLKGMRINLKLG